MRIKDSMSPLNFALPKPLSTLHSKSECSPEDRCFARHTSSQYQSWLHPSHLVSSLRLLEVKQCAQTLFLWFPSGARSKEGHLRTTSPSSMQRVATRNLPLTESKRTLQGIEGALAVTPSVHRVQPSRRRLS